jgi:hypothetical protein
MKTESVFPLLRDHLPRQARDMHREITHLKIKRCAFRAPSLLFSSLRCGIMCPKSSASPTEQGTVIGSGVSSGI